MDKIWCRRLIPLLSLLVRLSCLWLRLSVVVALAMTWTALATLRLSLCPLNVVLLHLSCHFEVFQLLLSHGPVASAHLHARESCYHFSLVFLFVAIRRVVINFCGESFSVLWVGHVHQNREQSLLVLLGLMKIQLLNDSQISLREGFLRINDTIRQGVIIAPKQRSKTYSYGSLR